MTVLFSDMDKGRSLGGVKLSTDMKQPLEMATPAPVFRIRVRGNTSRDFQLDLTLL